MNRLFDLIAVGCVAIVVLLPKASVDARPALSADGRDLARVAVLEDALVRYPLGDAAGEPTAVELAELYLRVEHPDWALITLAPYRGAESSAKLSLLRATAHAERLDAVASMRAIAEGRAACEARGCAPVIAARMAVIAAPMQALVDQKVDPRIDPTRAKEIVGKALHATRPGASAATKE